MKAIPKIIHQTWKERQVPPSHAAYQQSWLTHHPAWEYRLWTDADNRAFLAQHYAWFLPIYDYYPQPIMRVDAVRYFILYHYGGLYVDLDFESLQPVDDYLASHAVVIGLEPASHAQGGAQMADRPFDQILCNAFMASAPRHPFWAHLFQVLVGQHRESYPVSATGPYMLTRAYESFPAQNEIGLLAAALVCPVALGEPWPPVRRPDEQPVEPIAVHHWMATWQHKDAAPQRLLKQTVKRLLRHGVATLLKPWGYELTFKDATHEEPLLPHEVKRRRLVANLRQTLLPAGTPGDSNQIGFVLLAEGEVLLRGALDVAQAVRTTQQRPTLPLISALLASDGCLATLQKAVALWQAQRYPHKELVIIARQTATNSAGEPIATWLAGLADQRIIYAPLPAATAADEPAWLDLALQHATGAYVTLWSADVLAHPDRLTLQMAFLQYLQADGALLQRIQCCDPATSTLLVSARQLWAATGLYRKERAAVLRNLTDLASLASVEQWALTGRLLLLDQPDLYTLVGETATNGSMAQEAARTTACYTGLAYRTMRQKLQATLPFDLVPWLGDLSFYDNADRSKDFTLSPAQTKSKVFTTNPDGAWPPKILIAAAVRNARPWLPAYFAHLQRLTYPHQRLTVALVDRGSEDGTSAWLADYLARCPTDFAAVKCIQAAVDATAAALWPPSRQRQERAALAQSQNLLLAHGLTEESWVLWLDVRCQDSPPALLEQLLGVEEAIVTAHAVDAQGRSIDHSSFRLKPGAADWDWSPYLLDGILHPPVGHGRAYLNDFKQQPLVELDSVGDSVLLVRADLHRRGLLFPPVPYKYHIGAEGLAYLARDMGVRCWGMPQVEVQCAPVEVTPALAAKAWSA